MTKRYSIAEAGEHLSDLVGEVEAGNTVELTRDGHSVARLLPMADSERRSEGSFWEAYQDFRKEFDLAELAIDPDSVFAYVGALLPGRDFSW